MSDGHIKIWYDDGDILYPTIESVRKDMDSYPGGNSTLIHEVELPHELVGGTFVSDFIYKFLGDDPQRVKFVDGKELSLKALLFGGKL